MVKVMTQKINQINPKKPQSLIYLQQIIQGVTYLHQNNIVHCKLRLENIVLQNGKPKIIDFSEAIKVDQQKDKDFSMIELSYQSPEMLNLLYYEFDGQKYDIWCLGLILYQMLQGQMPFENIQNNTDLKNQISKSKFQITYPISQQVYYLLQAMLNADPKKRITLNDLKNFLDTQQNIIFEDDYLKVPIDIPIHIIIKELENYQIETVNLFQQLEQNKHCTLSTCYYLIKNKLIKSAKLKQIKLNLMNFESSKFNFITNQKKSFQFTKTKYRIYQNAIRVNTENNNTRSESLSQHTYKDRLLNKKSNKKQQQLKQSPKLSQTQNSFSPSQNNSNIEYKNNQKGNFKQKNQNQLEIISDGYSIQQEEYQQRLKNILVFNNNFIIQDKNKKRRSTSQKI